MSASRVGLEHRFDTASKLIPLPRIQSATHLPSGSMPALNTLLLTIASVQNNVQPVLDLLEASKNYSMLLSKRTEDGDERQRRWG